MLLRAPLVHAGGVWPRPALEWPVVQPARIGRKTHRLKDSFFFNPRKLFASGLRVHVRTTKNSDISSSKRSDPENSSAQPSQTSVNSGMSELERGRHSMKACHKLLVHPKCYSMCRKGAGSILHWQPRFVYRCLHNSVSRTREGVVRETPPPPTSPSTTCCWVCCWSCTVGAQDSSGGGVDEPSRSSECFKHLPGDDFASSREVRMASSHTASLVEAMCASWTGCNRLYHSSASALITACRPGPL